MSLSRILSFLTLTLCVSLACSRSLSRPGLLKPPGIPIVDVPAEAHDRLAAQSLPPYTTVYYFDQLIDHNNASRGTFKQRYWHTAEFYQPGGPIIFMNAGEVNAAPYYGYITNLTINGVIAQKYGGSAIVLEHRFFGMSNPISNLNSASLELLTVAQTIEDHYYFAHNVVLPQTNGDQLGPDKVPWIMFGGSYPGALVSWTMVAHPDLFWIGYASSAVVQDQIDFWQYFLPIQQNMPQNCSADVAAVIAQVDQVLMGTNTTAKAQLKALFGLDFYSDADFAGYLRWDLWTWQDLQPNSGPNMPFYQFCDALEVQNGVKATATGWGLNTALNAWAKHFRQYYLGESVISSSPPPAPRSFADIDVKVELEKRVYPIDDPGRSWDWLLCNELGISQDGPPTGVNPALVSRLMTVQYNLDICAAEFPDKWTAPPNLTSYVNSFNQKYQGWNVKAKRLFFANGKRDPWREMTVSAINSTAVSTADQPIGLGNGFHCSDLIVSLAAPDPSIVAVQNSFVNYVGTWLAEWPSR